MGLDIDFAELRALSPAERLRLIEELWDSLGVEPQFLEIPDWHRAELDRRLDEHAKDPAGTTAWSEVKARLPEPSPR